MQKSIFVSITMCIANVWQKEDRDMESENFPSYYTILFNGITDALEALDRQDFGRARAILIQSQQEAEEAYIEAGEPS